LSDTHEGSLHKARNSHPCHNQATKDTNTHSAPIYELPSEMVTTTAQGTWHGLLGPKFRVQMATLIRIA